MKRNALLVYGLGTSAEQHYPFADQIVIGRRRPQSDGGPETITIQDPTISSRHCIVTRSIGGRFFVRDVSSNGTRLAGRRLVPNVEVEIKPGDSLTMGDHVFVLETTPGDAVDDAGVDDDEKTRAIASEVEVTVLVGDIRGYTKLNQQFSAPEFFPSIHSVFAELEQVVVNHEGTIKEYQGDAIFAFWESNRDRPDWHARRACGAALALDSKLRQLAGDPARWGIREFPLRMDWALTTGPVLLSSLGGARPTGLAMVGDVVNYAFRLEKLANDETGPVLVCDHTYALAGSAFLFREIGKVRVEGYSKAQMIYALEGPPT